MPIADVLDFQRAHAKARDAVHTKLDTATLATQLPGAIIVKSAAETREIYLRRPDLGRQLHPDSAPLLTPGDYDIAFIIADGLSATAIMQNAIPTLNAALTKLTGFSIAPVVIATQARVAIGDDIGAALGAKLTAILIGERPGLSVAESLGIYLTYAPAPGTRDSARNCISNIHTQGGLSYESAATMLTWLIRESLRRKLTGVALKEASALESPDSTPVLA
jgi:ethanolamine ammonia-lyase small subunit